MRRRTQGSMWRSKAVSLLLCWSSVVQVVVVEGGFSLPARSSKALKLERFRLHAVRPPPPIPPPPPPLPSKGGVLDFDFDFDVSSVLPTEWDPSAVRAAVETLVQDLTHAVQQQLNGPEDWMLSLQDSIHTLQTSVATLDANLLEQLSRWAHELEKSVEQQAPSLGPLYTQLTSALANVVAAPQFLPTASSSTPPSVTLLVSSLVSYWLVNVVLTWGQPPPPTQPYPNNRYDPLTARAYFDRQWLSKVIPRSLFILVQSLQFALSLALDHINNQVQENEYQRGQELAELLTRLGPTFIKVGQSLSIRTDLLSPAYVRGLSTLQDQVPPFSTIQAKAILEQEWGRPVESVIVGDLPSQPVAAASLGQVYKARLLSTGQDVAIKVQRPDISEQIALDMHLLREFAFIAKRAFKLNTDTVGTVDAWGTGFVDELDYLQEASNAAFFSQRILTTPLKDVVFAPKVVNEVTTTSVLVTEWVDGERLDRCSNEDVTALCSIAMNTYLSMLLDDQLGVLHADPHPGNILRTPEGRLCILDWGMVTRISKDIQLTLIEHVAHLTSGDYKEVPRDLLLLGFIPPSKADLIADSGVVELLADIYSSWTKGGGVAAINVNDVINRLQDLTAEKGNLFQIPPYFAYIAKSFSVLEGIGLSNDPKYSIVNECLPYVSQRLLTDHEKMGPALSTFIFGPRKGDRDRIVDYRRVEQLAEGFGDYTVSVSTALNGKKVLPRTQVLENFADQVLSLIFTEEETPLQEIVVEQVAKITASSGRFVLTQVRERSGILPTGRTVLGTLFDPLGLWRTSPLFRMNALDEKTIEMTQKLIALMQKQAQTFRTTNPAFDLTTITPDEAIALTRILTRKIWERRMGIFQTGNRLARKLLQITADTLDHGERDSRILPERRPTTLQPQPQGQLAPATVVERLEPPKEYPSGRLRDARRRLEALTEEEIDITIVP